MAGNRTWSQHELRYQLDRLTAERVVGIITQRLPRVVYDEGAVKSLVVTTYLDTEDGHYLKIANSSDGRRSIKLRVREYLASLGDGEPFRYAPVCFLERKERVDEQRLKHRIEVNKTEIGGILTLARAVQDQSVEAHAIRTELRSLQLAPVLVSVYERVVFGWDDGLRVTFDERLAYYEPPEGLYDRTPALSPDTLGQPVARGPSRILEIKHPMSSIVPEWLGDVVGDLPQAHGFSKFRSGMAAIKRGNSRPVTLTRPLSILKA